MLCLSQKDIFALYLDDPARFAGIPCPPGWRYLQKFNSQLCVTPILKKSVWAIYLSHTENEKNEKKLEEGGFNMQLNVQ
jgi:hypothetical protein